MVKGKVLHAKQFVNSIPLQPCSLFGRWEGGELWILFNLGIPYSKKTYGRAIVK